MNDQDKAEAVQCALDGRIKCPRCGALLECPDHSSLTRIVHCFPVVAEDEHGVPYLQTCHTWG
jgi:hypothetical protein